MLCPNPWSREYNKEVCTCDINVESWHLVNRGLYIYYLFWSFYHQMTQTNFWLQLLCLYVIDKVWGTGHYFLVIACCLVFGYNIKVVFINSPCFWKWKNIMCLSLNEMSILCHNTLNDYWKQMVCTNEDLFIYNLMKSRKILLKYNA